MRAVKAQLLIVDLGLLAYWVVTALGLLPPEYAFKDYHDPTVVAWNWSFLPLDLAASLTGIIGVVMLRRALTSLPAMLVITVSLTLTFCAGLMAIAFWSFYRDFDPFWWVPNLALMVIPVLCAIQFWRLQRR
jgi:hypothetical protein